MPPGVYHTPGGESEGRGVPAALIELHQLPLDVSGPSVGRAPLPVPALTQDPGVGVVGQAPVEDLEELAAERGVLDGDDQLYPVVEVAGHEIRGADVDARLRARALERVDPRVLEEAPDHRDDLDVLRDARDARPQSADAPYVQLDGHAGLGGAVEGPDRARVEQRVHLHADAS